MHFTRVIEHDSPECAFLVKRQYFVMKALVLSTNFLLIEQGLLLRRVLHLALIECIQLIEFLRVLRVTTIVTVLISACKPVSAF